MRSELAAERARAEKIGRIIFHGGGRIIRSSANWIAPARCPTLEEDPHRLFEATSTLSRERVDACWAGRRFHACGACACAATWVSADHTRPDHPASGNCGNLLPECSLLRTADLVRRLKPGRLLGHRRFDGGFAGKSGCGGGLVRWRGLD